MIPDIAPDAPSKYTGSPHRTALNVSVATMPERK